MLLPLLLHLQHRRHVPFLLPSLPPFLLEPAIEEADPTGADGEAGDEGGEGGGVDRGEGQEGLVLLHDLEDGRRGGREGGEERRVRLDNDCACNTKQEWGLKSRQLMLPPSLLTL